MKRNVTQSRRRPCDLGDAWPLYLGMVSWSVLQIARGMRETKVQTQELDAWELHRKVLKIKREQYRKEWAARKAAATPGGPHDRPCVPAAPGLA